MKLTSAPSPSEPGGQSPVRDPAHTGHDHAHGHDHAEQDHAGHGHGGHGHSHAPANFGRAFAIGIVLNVVYVAAEAGYGLVSHSLALLADAGHNLGDVLGLAAAWGASLLGRQAPRGRFTYGLRRSSILAAVGNAVLLLVITGGIAWEAVRRLIHPEPAGELTVMVVSAIGILVNGATAMLFFSGRKGDLNIRGAFLHMASDTLVTVGVLISAGIMLATGWLRIDPLVSLLVAGVVVAGSWSLLKDSLGLAMDAVPPGVDLAEVQVCLAELPGVTEVHDLHIWAMSTTETALTAHLVRADAAGDDRLLSDAADVLDHRFGVQHVTLQLEFGRQAEPCVLNPGPPCALARTAA